VCISSLPPSILSIISEIDLDVELRRLNLRIISTSFGFSSKIILFISVIDLSINFICLLILSLKDCIAAEAIFVPKVLAYLWVAVTVISPVGNLRVLTTSLM